MLIVETLADLDRLLEPRSRYSSRVVLGLDHLTPIDRDLWERRINRHYRACGCETGAVAMVVAAIGIGVLVATNYELFLEHPIRWGGLGVIVLCAALATGKAFGLWLSRLKLKSTIEAIRHVRTA